MNTTITLQLLIPLLLALYSCEGSSSHKSAAKDNNLSTPTAKPPIQSTEPLKPTIHKTTSPNSQPLIDFWCQPIDQNFNTNNSIPLISEYVYLASDTAFMKTLSEHMDRRSRKPLNSFIPDKMISLFFTGNMEGETEPCG